MIGVWDWHHPRKNEADEVALATLTAEMGFDTLIVGNPGETLLAACRSHGVRVVGVVSPVATAEFAEDHSDCLQRMLVEEEAAVEALRGLPPHYNAAAGRWYPIFQPSRLVCYRHEASAEFLRGRVRDTLERADGVALDGFGFRNHHRCCCADCREAVGADGDAVEYSRETLVSCSQLLYRYAKEISVDAIVMNHVWPPFRPDPGYSSQLQLDYCSETISWFYPPVWSIDRVELELRSRSGERRRNTFVPFIGLFWEERCRRTPERIAREIELAREYAPSHLVFSTYSGILADDGVRRVVREQLRRYRR